MDCCKNPLYDYDFFFDPNGMGSQEGGGYVFQNAQAEAYYTALKIANGGADINAQALYSITLNQLKQAIDNFFVTGAADGWLNKIIALYLYIGGTAATHAINAVNPGAFNLTFYGSPTHSGAGTQYNGATQYAMTGFTPSVHLSSLASFIGFNSKTNTPSPSNSYVGVGSQGTTSERVILFKPTSTQNVRYDAWTASQTVNATTNNTNNDFIGARSTGQVRIYLNGNLDAQTTVSGGTLSPIELAIAAFNNNGTITLFAPWLFTYHVIGNTDISSPEVLSFYNARNLLDTTLNR